LLRNESIHFNEKTGTYTFFGSGILLLLIMKIAVAQQNYLIGDCKNNALKIINAIREGKKNGASLIVFSELCICGYPPLDFLEFDDFIQTCYDALEEIKLHADTIGVLVGCPAKNETKKGKGLFNAAFFLYEKEIKAVVHKTLLPNYDIFDEYRYFEPAFEWNIIPFMGKRLAVTICEDIWDMGNAPLYRINPMEKLLQQSPDLMINLSASPFDYTHPEDRKAIIKSNVEKYHLPIIYCNTVGSQTEIVFDGGSIVADKESNIRLEMKTFGEDMQYIQLLEDGTFDKDIISTGDTLPQMPLDPEFFEPSLNIHLVYEALILGLRDYFKKMGFSKAILGSSGGIDSAVALAIACDALGAENVHALLMPSAFSSHHSVEDATQLSVNLGNPYEVISIENIYKDFLQSLQPVFKDRPFNVAEENIQSRSRGNLLMAIANKFGYILLNTSNKSELATGYGTLYGDMAGGISILGDCYKQQVYALAHFINRYKKIIPENILLKPPSAELKPDQKDSDSLPDYAILDAILYQYIERRMGPKEIKDLGFESSLVDRILKMVNTNEYKRKQFCPIIRISSKAFGSGRRMPIVGKYLS